MADPRDFQHYQQFASQHSSYNDLNIVSFSPHHGRAGDEVTIWAKTTTDLRQFPAAEFWISFANHRCPASMAEMGVSMGTFQYGFVAEVPNMRIAPGQASVPVSLHFEDAMFGAYSTMAIGYFHYQGRSQGVPDNVASATSLLSISSPFGDESDISESVTPGSTSNIRARRHLPRIEIPAAEVVLDDVSQADSPARRRVLSPASSARHGRMSHHTPTSSTAGAPTLVRTSTIRQPVPGSAVNSPDSFTSYGLHMDSKARLELEGSLDAMAFDWSDEETAASRRLVQFERRQEGNTIYAAFKPVSGKERKLVGPCISCIWWKEKNEAYVTSVDTIYLLESLVAVRFTVEEKNRIRRNLEGFHPMTVSKAKHDSEDFFSIIMGFPDPKPRNIEKDVKVFPWRALAPALKKIIGKYSASYTSTVATTQFDHSQSFASSSSRPSHYTSQASMPPTLVRASTSHSDQSQPETFSLRSEPGYSQWSSSSTAVYDQYQGQQYLSGQRSPQAFGHQSEAYPTWDPATGSFYDPNATMPPGQPPYGFGR